MPGFEWFGDEERAEVGEVLETGVLFRYGFDGPRKGRWKAREFEKKLAARLGVSHCHAVSSGTAALSTALAACGIGPGDEVIVPPFTFVATVEAVLQAGAAPVFADIDETLCLAPEAAAAAHTRKTRAVLPVHMCGGMARIEALADLCAAEGTILIEDACQAIGGTFRGRALGTFGRAGCFSFDYVKTITCGEGGAVVTDDPEVHRLADAYADHGHDHLGADRGADGHPIPGLNFRIGEMNAAAGLAQLRKLDRILERQRAAKVFLKSTMAGLPGVSFRELPDPDGDSATFLSFLLPDEDRARTAARDLAAAGLDGCFYWYDNNWHYIRQWDHFAAPAWPPEHARRTGIRKPELPRSDAIMSRTLSLLIKLSWDDAELDRRAGILRRVLNKG
jgi:8-amino-3,8-dideoxy-alpha-D-manno-octulosonate transaminase